MNVASLTPAGLWLSHKTQGVFSTFSLRTSDIAGLMCLLSVRRKECRLKRSPDLDTRGRCHPRVAWLWAEGLQASQERYLSCLSHIANWEPLIHGVLIIPQTVQCVTVWWRLYVQGIIVWDEGIYYTNGNRRCTLFSIHISCDLSAPFDSMTLAFLLRAASPLTSRTQLSHDLPSALHKEHLFTEHL